MKLFLHVLFFFLLLTQICFGQWVQVGLNNKSIKDIAVQNPNIFAVTSDSSVYRSLDNGANWNMIVDSNAADIAISPTGKVFMIKDSTSAYPYFSILFTSLDNGVTWTRLNITEQLIDSLWGWPRSITFSPAGIVFCSLNSFWGLDGRTAIAKSTDDGLTWTTPGLGVMGGNLFNFRNQFLITDGMNSGGGAYSSSIFLSSDSGKTWDYLGYPIVSHPSVLGLFSVGSIIVGGYSSLSISMDMCSSWTKISSINTQVGLSWQSGSSEGMLIGTEDLGVFLFSDEGDSLGSRNDGLINLNIQVLALDNNDYVYAGTGDGIWRRPLSETVLPVELTSFTAQAKNQKVILRWTTATELNNNGFEIQRKVAESDFATVGFVRGEGTTTNQKQYSYIDKDLVDGKYFYRLKQVDYNGTYEYSNEIEVDVRSLDEYTLEQNFPNPFNPITTIGYVLREKTNAKLILLNAIGEEVAVLVNEEQDKGFHKVDFNASNLASGVYFYHLNAGNYLNTKKMILLK